MANADKTEVFSKAPVKVAVLKQIAPAVASQMISLIYGLADAFFVGLLNDPAQTAAVTVAASAYILITAISNLFGVGAASTIAWALGRNQTERVARISSVAFWGALAGGLLYSVVFALLARPLLTLCGATRATYATAFAYGKWTIILGGPFAVLNMLLANLIRAEGGANCASFGISFGGVLNILLDPLFILPRFLGFGAEGAGMATALSNAASTLFFLGYVLLRRGGTLLRLSPRRLRGSAGLVRPILAIGFPSALQFTLTMIAVSAQLKFMSPYATQAVAAMGIVKKLDQVPLSFAVGVASGLLPLLAYNHAAGNQVRRSQAFRFGVSLSLGFGLLSLVCYELLAPQLVALFIDDPLTIHYGASFLRRAVVAMPLMAVCYPMIIQFQAMGKVRQALIASILRKGTLDIPVLFVMDALFPLYGCAWVQPIVDAISLVVILCLYRHIQWKELKKPRGG